MKQPQLDKRGEVHTTGMGYVEKRGLVAAYYFRGMQPSLIQAAGSGIDATKQRPGGWNSLLHPVVLLYGLVYDEVSANF